MPSPEDRLGTSAPVPSPRRPRKRSRFLAAVRGTFAVITIVGFVGAGAGAVVLYTVYEEYSADLPSLDGLRTYQPPVVSRITRVTTG